MRQKAISCSLTVPAAPQAPGTLMKGQEMRKGVIHAAVALTVALVTAMASAAHARADVVD